MAMGMIDEKTRLPRICRKCFYRRYLENNTFYEGKSTLNSCCCYILIEEEPRGCTPTDTECAKFKPRTMTKSLTGRHEMIK
jgi:hypothetical protein